MTDKKYYSEKSYWDGYEQGAEDAFNHAKAQTEAVLNDFYLTSDISMLAYRLTDSKRGDVND